MTFAWLGEVRAIGGTIYFIASPMIPLPNASGRIERQAIDRAARTLSMREANRIQAVRQALDSFVTYVENVIGCMASCGRSFCLTPLSIGCVACPI
jgi:hypothetical protein